MEIPCALVKDLRSTGYFYDELKGYSEPPNMDIATYCVNFVTPYLVRVAESFDKTGQRDKSRILKLAITHLSDPKESEIVDLVLGLRTIAVSEVDKASKANFAEHLNRSESFVNSQKLRSAELLVKLLVSVIKTFKLTDSGMNRKKADKAANPVFEAVNEAWRVWEDNSA